MLQSMAEALLNRDALQLRLLVQAWMRNPPRFDTIPCPQTDDVQILAAAAGLVELLALRLNQEPPKWTSAVAPLPTPFFVMRRAERPGFTRDLSVSEAPEPLKRRNIFAPPNFLQMV